uniref:Uncharacterized protein n=1 Tax=Tanacetum cinerariifolium TaxID=118510 RepID=A0A6L2JXH1_TANCI|nr:hypothetical protein [Tanacetum cinerariifolium]
MTTTTTTHPLPPQPQQSTTDSLLIKRIGELEQIMTNLIQDNKYLEERDLPEADMKEILHQRMWETNSYKAHEDHMMLYEALEKSMNRDHTDELLKDLDEAHRKKKKRRPSRASGSPRAPGSSQVPPPPPSTNQEGQLHGSTTPSSSKTAASAKYTAWTTTDTRLSPFVSSIPEDLHMDDDLAPDAQAHLSDDEDIRNAHISKASALASTYTPSPEDSLLAQTGDMAMFMDWFCKRKRITELKPQDLEGPAFELVKVFHPNVIHLQYQIEEFHKLLTYSVDDSIIRHNVSKPLPLGGPPGQVTIQFDFFFNKDLEYLRYGSKGSRPALSISKMKAAYYPDVGLEQMVPDHMWIEEILSVVRIEVLSMYGYDYMKKIILRRADLNEHIIAERDFKYLYPSDFEDLYLLNLQGHLNHLSPKDKKILIMQSIYGPDTWLSDNAQKTSNWGLKATRLSSTSPNLDGMPMALNTSTTSRDDTLHQIDEALDYRVKEFKVNRMNPGLNTRFWTRKDVDRSKEFMFAIQKRLKTRRIFRNLESFVGERFSDDTLHQIDEALDYQVKELKINRMNPVDIEKAAVCSSLRSLKPKRTIESRAKRSSKIISLGNYSIMLASSHTVKSKTNIKSPTHYPSVGFNSLVHSLRALSNLRRSGLRTASAAAKPCQGDSSELYLITSRILTVAAAGQRDVNSQPHAHTSNSLSMT